MTEDESAIRQVVETWMRASKEGDLATVLNLMTDDVVFTVPDKEPFGRDEFAAAAQNMSEMRMQGSSQILEVQVCGEWAFTRNHIKLTITPKERESVVRSGYTLTIFRKEVDGQWRIARDANLVTTRS